MTRYDRDAGEEESEEGRKVRAALCIRRRETKGAQARKATPAARATTATAA